MPADVLTRAHTAAGFFGKVPARGDFVTRRLPHNFITPWDAWVRKSMLSSREKLASGWLNAYLTCPVWRFAVATNVCGDCSWAGVLIPSVDRIGRYYPFTLAAKNVTEVVDVRIFEIADEWFRRAETLALSCLTRSFVLEEFDQRVQQLEPLINGNYGHAEQTMSTPPTGKGRGWRITEQDAQTLRQRYTTLLPAVLSDILQTTTLWWTQGSERVAPSFMVYDALPPPEHFACLIGGDWGMRSDPPTRRH